MRYSSEQFKKDIRKAVKLEIFPSDPLKDDEISRAFQSLKGSNFKVMVIRVIPKVAKGKGSIFKVSIELLRGDEKEAFKAFNLLLRMINMELATEGYYFEDISNTKHEFENIYSKDFVAYLMI